MVNDSKEIVDMIEMLPDDKKQQAYEMVKSFIKAWDPNYTKTTPAEQKRLDEADKDWENKNTVNFEDINWN